MRGVQNFVFRDAVNQLEANVARSDKHPNQYFHDKQGEPSLPPSYPYLPLSASLWLIWVRIERWLGQVDGRLHGGGRGARVAHVWYKQARGHVVFFGGASYARSVFWGGAFTTNRNEESGLLQQQL